MMQPTNQHRYVRRVINKDTIHQRVANIHQQFWQEFQLCRDPLTGRPEYYGVTIDGGPKGEWRDVPVVEEE